MNEISAAVCSLLPSAVISLSAHLVVEGFSIPIIYEISNWRADEHCLTKTN